MIELSEQTIMDHVVVRLAQRYPALPEATIVEVVRQNHARFDSRRVRDYIPLFVERGATEQLARLDAADRLALA